MFGIPAIKTDTTRLLDGMQMASLSQQHYKIIDLLQMEVKHRYSHVSFQATIQSSHIVINGKGKRSLVLACVEQAGSSSIMYVVLKEYCCGFRAGRSVHFTDMRIRSGEGINSANICHSSRASSYIIENNATTTSRAIPPAPINNDTMTNKKNVSLCDINRSSDLNVMYIVVADITSIISLELSYSCQSCINDNVAICHCTRIDFDQMLFKGQLECEVSDGTGIRRLLVQDEVSSMKILHIDQLEMQKVKRKLVDMRKIGIWKRSSRNMPQQQDVGQTNGNGNSDDLEGDTINLLEFSTKHKWRTHELTVRRQDDKGDRLLCIQVGDVDTKDQSWSIIERLAKQ
ncbi:hypothetical protein SAMD00019534_093320 [Acytostelium subglobosum LB1]|uniref:hypothetical protein n=1 Tax=Acytostelium subglobosum LB1 TaxID=1410327 RepID=UPI000644AA97|nr:hypothetical protein SAMD00019534_093320 [Acytostelium subglobosum LB1]GAM26157.1 hypothetical protein SAMD00019534_093320 [Acytostelium subglobosum LB1]|eukprot:XP_012750711.1 hypothetical protein SAMD00019534_093320 [Acytostelium subglobosum LB1]